MNAPTDKMNPHPIARLLKMEEAGGVLTDTVFTPSGRPNLEQFARLLDLNDFDQGRLYLAMVEHVTAALALHNLLAEFRQKYPDRVPGP